MDIATAKFFEVVMCANEIHDERDILVWYLRSNHTPTKKEVFYYMKKNYPYDMKNIDKVDSIEEVSFEEAMNNTCCSLEYFSYLI